LVEQRASTATEPEAGPPGLREQLDGLDRAVFRAIAATPTPSLDRAFGALSRAANHSKLWMATAAPFTARSPSTTLPAWSTRTRSLCLIMLKCIPNGFTQYESGNSGSRAVTWPATPSSSPALLNMRNAAASRTLRW